MNLPSLFTRTLVASMALTAAAFSSASAATLPPLFEYRFNEEGTRSASVGTDRTEVTLLDENQNPTDLHSASGLGVSGQTGDRAFDNSAATGSGGEHATGGQAQQIGSDAMNRLSSFTLQGWYAFTATDTFQGARLIEKRGGPASSLSLFAGAGSRSGTLTLALITPTSGSSISAISKAHALLGERNAWIFFAVTYDGSLLYDNLRFYVGSSTSRVVEIGTAKTLNAGALGEIDGPLVFGNNQRGNRPWQGMLDNLRIFGDPMGSGGALSLEDLEALRTADLTGPSPTPAVQ